MLKFLEEPDGNVIGFFITNNIDNVLPTIQSRCQHLDVIFENQTYEALGIEKEKYDEYFSVVKNYLEGIEFAKTDLILYNKKYLNNYEKKEIIIIFKLILEIYISTMEKNNKYNLEFLKTYNRKNIKKKINLIITLLKEISYNVNLELLLDRFVIEMDMINNESL